MDDEQALITITPNKNNSKCCIEDSEDGTFIVEIKITQSDILRMSNELIKRLNIIFRNMGAIAKRVGSGIHWVEIEEDLDFCEFIIRYKINRKYLEQEKQKLK